MSLSETRAQTRAHVIALSQKSSRKPKTKRSARAQSNRTHLAAAAVLAVAVVLLGLSLSHLAAGIALVTGAGQPDGWLMAIGIDVGFIALELAVLAAPPDKRAAVSAYAVPAITGTLAISAAMNAFAFGAHADGLLIYPAAALGLAIPGLIFSLTRVAAVLWIEA